MTLWIAKPCGCEQDVYMGERRERLCELHDNLFVRADAAGKTKAPRRAKAPERDWADARSKVEEEGCCRICKSSDVKLEAAHVLGREHDEPKFAVHAHSGEFRASKVLWVNPDRVIPLCGPFPEGCHGDAEYRRINVLQYLTLEEQIQAVKDAGGIEAARIRLEPVTYREEVEASSAIGAAR